MSGAASDPPFECIGVVGVGLIGGSIALAAREAWPAVEVVGVDRESVTAAAADRGVITAARGSVRDLGDVDLLLLTAPVPAIIQLLTEVAACQSTAIVSDVGSTKREIVETAGRLGLARFIGGHPMAGSERDGFEHAAGNLFTNRPWLLTPTAASSAEDVARMSAFVAGIGARPRTIAALDHDRLVAFVSHLPQVVAVSLLASVGDTLGDAALDLAGPAFRDMTRVAGSSVDVWRGVLASNADFIEEAIRALQSRLPRRAVELVDASWTDKAFAAAQTWRRHATTPPPTT